jgi:RHS repeat-associated protein
VFDAGGSGFGPSLQPETRQDTWTFPYNMTCRPTGTYLHKVTARHCNGTVLTATKDVMVNADQSVTVTTAPPDDQGNMDVTVAYNFPNTDSASQRRVDLQSEDAGGTGVMASFQPEEQSGEKHFTRNVACAASGSLTFLVGKAWSCNRGPVENRRPVTLSHKPTVSVSVAHGAPDSPTAIVSYSFVGTGSPAQRTLRLEWATGGLIGETHPETVSGQQSFPLPSCGTADEIRAVAIACGDEYAEAQTAGAAPAPPKVVITLRKGAKDPATGRRIVEGRLDYDMGEGSANWSTRADLLPWTNANGQTSPGQVLLAPEVPPQRVGVRMFTLVPPSDAQQLSVRGTADSCAGRGTHDASIDCACDATDDPVYFADGNVRVTDGEPLPTIAGHSLVRTYNSDEQVVALFGRGWTTLFDRRMILNSDGSEQIISIVTETNEVVTFRETSGVFAQSWPTARGAFGTLTYDAISGTYLYRPAGSGEQAVFRASDGRLLALRDLATGHEAQLAYAGSDVPASLTDSWTGVTWNLAIDSANRRVTSISVSGRPDLVWTYSYDADGNLLTVLAPGNAQWRTYEHDANRMTVSRDALGNLLESHTYDADGYGISSTGPSDEIATIEYNLPGAIADERVTRVTYKSGATAEYALRPLGGAWRPVRATGGCAGCGARDATYVRDVFGRVVREQGADGYITRTSHVGDHVSSVEHSLKPAACDPPADPQRCRLGPDALAAAPLAPTEATFTTSYEHTDMHWRDQVTAALRESVAVAGQSRRETYAYHSTSGTLVTTAVCGWTAGGSLCDERTRHTTLYERTPFGLMPAFDPGGPFQSSWLTLPQPAYRPRSVDGPRTDVEDVSSFVYYPIDSSVPALLRGHLAAVQNAAGHITRYEVYDVFGNVIRMVDADGGATEMTFDSLGRPLSSTTKAIPGCNTTLDPLCATDLISTRAYASGAGPLRLDQRPGGGVVTYAYDARGRLQTISRGPAENDLRERIETGYDALTGRKSLERTLAYEAGTWVEKQRQSFAYDSHGRLQTVTHADGATIHYTYDPEDRMATIRDENHATPDTAYAYDPAGRLAAVTQTLAGAPGGVITTRYSYDFDGNLTSVTDPNGNVTRYVYDDFGQMLSQDSPVTGATGYAYDSAGNMTQMTDANGATTTRAYDALNRVTTATSTRGSNSEVVTWSYDDPTSGRFAIGRLSSMTDPSGSTAYHYDRRGLLRNETRTLTAAQYTYTTEYGHDADGNRAVIRYPSTQLTVEYAFDHAGRPTSASGVVTAATYQPFGPLKSVSFANGTTQTMTYDQRYRMTSNKLTAPSTTIAHYTYVYDAAGNITGLLDATDPSYDRTFQYDDLNRLTVANTGTSLWQRGTYTWDAMGNLLALKLGEVEKGPTDPLDLARDGRERLRTEENVPMGRSSSFGYSEATPRLNAVTTNDLSRPVGYDNAGNETSYAVTRTYSPRNLLAQIADPGEPGEPLQHTLTYTYDGRGICVIRAESPANGPGTTTARRFSIYTPELQLLAVTLDDASSVWALSAADKNIHYEIVWFAGRPVAQVTPAGPRLFTFADHLGTPIVQTDATATVTWRAEYEPFGNVWEMRTGPRTAQPLRFPGQEFAMNWEGQEENYNIHRWYRSGWGRYTQSDPIGFNGGTNLYAYVGGNPINASDPLGLKTELVCRPVRPGGWAGAVIGVVGFFTTFKPLHCRLRVTCPCSDGKGNPKAPFDKTVGWENITGQGLRLTQDESLAAGYDDGVFGPWFPVPVQSKASGCDFERCALSLHKNMGSHLPPYNAMGPNSNSYVNHLIKSCGGSANFPPGAIGGSPNPWYGGGGFN